MYKSIVADFSEDRGKKLYAASLERRGNEADTETTQFLQLSNAARPGRPQDDVDGPRPA